ncbi:MAG: SseB family protein [Pseudoprimorskyibacter sp.]|nr:SseB family protein [Pseudoprimorskyibacter sp.]
MVETHLDKAHAAMAAAPEDERARMACYAQLAGSDLVLMLRAEPTDDILDPEIFEVGGARVALVFDSDDRLAEFADRIVPYVGLSGRVLVNMMAGQDIGLGVNLGQDQGFVMPSEAVEWLAITLENTPEETEARPAEFHPPGGLPEALITALDQRLAAAAGLARKAYLAGVTYDDGRRSHVLGITGCLSGAEGALAQAINEALIFSGIEAGALDVLFVADSDEAAAALARVGLRFDLPKPDVPSQPKPPGSDPSAPPILR